ncbi:MAG: hypothetical protein KAZ71_08320 [Bacteroidia bacterium]|jgi:hypothetical protein|nr:hypothetical protein [Bacteroidia bacterium]
MKNLILIFFSFIIISCNDDDVEPIVVIPYEPVIINSILVGKGNLASTEGISQQNIIINNDNIWMDLRNQIDALYIANGLGNYFTETFFEETIIDFANYTVIAVFDRGYSNRGHFIEVTNVTEFENNIVIIVEKSSVVNTQNVASQPYHIVKIPKATKPIVFE